MSKVKHQNDDEQVVENFEEAGGSEPCSEVEIERDEYKTKLLRALADYHNLERRVAEEKKETGKLATRNFILRLLPFLDNLEQAEVFIKDPGLQMIKKNFVDTLEGEGLKKIELLNKKYDVEKAEAVEVVEGPKDDVVVEVLRNGYEFDGQLVRPAQVKVSKKLQVSN